MPPKTRPTKSQTARKNDKDVSSDKQQSTCDGCLDVVAENDALKCSSCSVWLHCYCAGIPRSHFEQIASFFTCSACSLTASRTVVTELKSEISALKQEIQELKEALIQEKHASQSMAKELDELRSSQTVDGDAPTERSYAASVGRKPRETRRMPRRVQKQVKRTSAPAPSGGGSGSSGTMALRNSDPAAATNALREPVSGARRVWGTLPLITCTTVKNTIAHLTKLNSVNEIQVKRKFISRQSTRSGKDKWWFVLHGDENSLKSLETTWETVKLQTGWQLEQCTKPIDAGVAAAQPPPTAATTENSTDDQEVSNVTIAPTSTDTTTPSHSQASINPVPSTDSNQPSGSHSFLGITQVPHSPPPPVL